MEPTYAKLLEDALRDDAESARQSLPASRCRTFDTSTFARCTLARGHEGQCQFEQDRKV